MAHREISSEEELLGEFYADIFSYCPRTHILVSQKMIALQNIVLIQKM